MKPQEIEAYNALVELANEVQSMFAQLDDYRKTKDKTKLFAVRTHETRARKHLATAAHLHQKLAA